jgi:hypothetical protein
MADKPDLEEVTKFDKTKLKKTETVFFPVQSDNSEVYP